MLLYSLVSTNLVSKDTVQLHLGHIMCMQVKNLDITKKISSASGSVFFSFKAQSHRPCNGNTTIPSLLFRQTRGRQVQRRQSR